MKKIIVAVLVLGFLGGLGAYFYIKNNSSSDVIQLYGNIEIRQVDMSFQVGGAIKQMLKEEGDEVQKGELIAQLDDRDYMANLNAAKAAAHKAKAFQTDAQQKWERNQILCETNTISKQDCDTITNMKNQASAELEAALAQVDLAENKLKYTKLYAPDFGVVTTRAQEPGAIVGAGQAVYSISKTRPVWVRAYLSEKDLGNVKYGMGAIVETDALDPKSKSKRTYSAYVGYISPVAEFTPKNVQTTDLRTSLVYRVKIYLKEPDEFTRQGMPVTIKINLNSEDLSQDHEPADEEELSFRERLKKLKGNK